ncbi:MAG: hypothetical protein NZM09_12090 [Ignavibacterium sp.]|nr:hypothetical protein [Ignavibacterium sp.]MDW8376415.1 hypothetical protein [Ignavibacteriales bacterium]
MKAWYKSKTIWVNLLSLAIELAQYLLNAQIVPSGTILVIVNLLNIILRFLHTQAVGLTNDDKRLKKVDIN